METLTDKEWQALQVIARSLLQNCVDEGNGYVTTGDTLIAEEVELLKKIAK